MRVVATNSGNTIVLTFGQELLDLVPRSLWGVGKDGLPRPAAQVTYSPKGRDICLRFCPKGRLIGSNRAERNGNVYLTLQPSCWPLWPLHWKVGVEMEVHTSSTGGFVLLGQLPEELPLPRPQQRGRRDPEGKFADYPGQPSQVSSEPDDAHDELLPCGSVAEILADEPIETVATKELPPLAAQVGAGGTANVLCTTAAGDLAFTVPKRELAAVMVAWMACGYMEGGR